MANTSKDLTAGNSLTRDSNNRSNNTEDSDVDLGKGRKPIRHRNPFALTAIAAASFLSPDLASGAIDRENIPALTSSALNYEIETGNLRLGLKFLSSPSMAMSPEIGEFGGLLAQRLNAKLVPLGFLHHCRGLIFDIKKGNIPESSRAIFAELVKAGDPGFNAFLAEFVTKVCPKFCPRIFASALKEELELA